MDEWMICGSGSRKKVLDMLPPPLLIAIRIVIDSPCNCRGGCDGFGCLMLSLSLLRQLAKSLVSSACFGPTLLFDASRACVDLRNPVRGRWSFGFRLKYAVPQPSSIRSIFSIAFSSVHKVSHRHAIEPMQQNYPVARDASRRQPFRITQQTPSFFWIVKSPGLSPPILAKGCLVVVSQ